MTHRIASAPTRSIDLTLALFKPDICANPIVTQAVISTLQAQNFTIVKSKNILWRQQDAELFYNEHKGRFFYERLCGYMTSGQFKALILAKENAIQDWRALIGPTHPVRAKLKSPGTLRALYGITDTRNSFHGSDSIQTAKREIEFFFAGFDVVQWAHQNL